MTQTTVILAAVAFSSVFWVACNDCTVRPESAPQHLLCGRPHNYYLLSIVLHTSLNVVFHPPQAPQKLQIN